MKGLITPLALLIWAASTATALADTDYRCKIERIYDATGENSNFLELQRKSYIGKEFTVDRRTGVMVGTLKNAYYTEPAVIDPGSQENAFKAVTTLRLNQVAGFVGSSASMLVINEFEDSASKSFMFASGSTAYFGKCEHF